LGSAAGFLRAPSFFRAASFAARRQAQIGKIIGEAANAPAPGTLHALAALFASTI
jgi:hypothetical protein